MKYSNLSPARLIEEALRKQEGLLSNDGALVVQTGKFTGRAAKDKYIVKDSNTEKLVAWGAVNQPMAAVHFQNLKRKVLHVLESKDSYEMLLSVGADPSCALSLVVHTELASHALFARTMFRQPESSNDSRAAASASVANHPDPQRFKPFRLYCAPSALADAKNDGTRGEPFVCIDFSAREIVIGGTRYAGEIKKSVFTVMNYLLPQRGVLSMHASVNCDSEKNTAIFFGLSGTGKTTLSADSSRRLIGDDEHGWSAKSVFNIEGGCYAKAIHLSAHAEPEIWQACHSFGTLLENVAMNADTRIVNFDSDSITENTRAAYKIEKIQNFEPDAQGGQPTALIMLACDAFGVLPPLARLTPLQAMYYFLSGYTAKVAGTEAGVTEPTSAFSACFGEPFMALHPTVYAKLLGERLAKQNIPCYLVNTGWWKGPYGVGERMPISMSRTLVKAALSGELATANYERDPLFGFDVPLRVEGLEPRHLRQKNTWRDGVAYEAQAQKLAKMFAENFKRYQGLVEPSLQEAGPRVILEQFVSDSRPQKESENNKA